MTKPVRRDEYLAGEPKNNVCGLEGAGMETQRSNVDE